MKSRKLPPFIAVVTVVLLAMGTMGCSEDSDPLPTLPQSGDNPPPPGGSSGPGNSSEPDAGDDAGYDADVGDDTDDDAGPDYCDLEPSDMPADPSRPCCFDDRDCWESDAPQANQMFCYHSHCDDGLQGVCRVPPEIEDECWDKKDCPEGQICPYEMDPENLDCELYTRETPDICIDE